MGVRVEEAEVGGDVLACAWRRTPSVACPLALDSDVWWGGGAGGGGSVGGIHMCMSGGENIAVASYSLILGTHEQVTFGQM